MRGKSGYLSTMKACFSIFRIKTIAGFQYRFAGFAGASTSIFWILIEITVYRIFYLYASNKEAGIIAGLTLKQIITYVWLAQLFFLMQPMNIDDEILGKITSGDVGIEMCRPLDLYFHWFAKTAASRLTPLLWRGSIILCAALIMPLTYRISPPASFTGFICMFISMISAFLLCASYGMFACAVRLNITWGDGPTYMIMLIAGILSGAYLPLQLWPKSMQGFLLIQPFAGYLDIPLRLYIGTMPSKSAIWVISLQIMWSIVFVVIGRTLTVKRLKNIIVQGG